MSFYGKRIYNMMGNIWRGFRLGNMDKENYTFPVEGDVPENPEEILFFPTVDYDEGIIYTGNHWLQIKKGDKQNSIEIWHAKPGIDAATNDSLAEITKEVDSGTINELKEQNHVLSPHDTITTTVFHYDAAGHISETSTETYWLDDERIVALEEYRTALDIDVGDDTHIIYWKQGMPVASKGTVGSTIKPVWLNNGVITAFKDTIGSGIKPIWMMGGDLVASAETVGSGIKPIYLQDGTITASAETVGSDIDFVWLKEGAITKSNGTIAAGGKTIMFLENGTLKASTANVGEDGVSLVYLNKGVLTLSDQNVGDENTPVYLKNGKLVPLNFRVDEGEGAVLMEWDGSSWVPSTKTVGSAVNPVFLSLGRIINSTANVGANNQFTYMKDGIITASTLTLGANGTLIEIKNGVFANSTQTTGAVNIPVWLNKGVITAFNQDVGANTKFTYFAKGALTASTATVGTATQPIFLSTGTFTASTADIGGIRQPMYMAKGVLTPITDTVGNESQAIYLKAGVLTAMTQTIGSAIRPVYIKNGILTPCAQDITNSVSASARNVGSDVQQVWLKDGVIVSSAATIGGRNQPIYLNGGIVTAFDQSIGDSSHPIYLDKGIIKPCGVGIGDGQITGEDSTGDTILYLEGSQLKASKQSIGANNRFVYLLNGKITASTVNVGSENAPVYIKNGTITACTSVLGNYLPLTGGTLTGDLIIETNLEVKGNITGNKVYGAVWNDYAEYRDVEEVAAPGRAVVETSTGKMRLAKERLEAAAAIISDTYGFAIGETKNAKTPIAIAGRVLAYPYEDKDEFQIGDAVCSGPDGTVSRMTREEIIQYPDRILGIVSEIPQYKVWGEDKVPVYNRIWIRVK